MGIVLIITVLSLILAVSVFASDGPDPLSIADKKTYPEFYEPFTPSEPIPESELCYLNFSEEWILKNDVDPDPETVEITFPASWLKETPSITKDEKVIELVVPTILLEAHNVSKNAEEITVSFPNYYFDGLPTKDVSELLPSSETLIELSAETDSATGGTKGGIEYAERIRYDKTAGDDVTGASGRVRPRYHYNPDVESFLTYQEIEFYAETAGDAFEVICEMTEYEEDTKVWITLHINGEWKTEFDCGTLVDLGDWVNYEVYYLNYWAFGFIEYPDDTWYYDYLPDFESPADDIEYFTGSCEIDTVGGLSDDIFTGTLPVSIESLKTDSGWQSASYVDQRLDFDLFTGYEPYVSINDAINSSGLFFSEFAFN